MIDLFDNKTEEIDLEDLDKTEYPPIVSPEDEALIKKIYKENDILNNQSYLVGSDIFDPNEPWIQTFSGKRFTPTKPNPQSIVIQDIAHSLSMQCRFSGHISKFYSVAQHSVLVSYICNFEDALWGLLHDATEAFLVDIPSPLKRSKKFEAYVEFEKKMQEAICIRFNLSPTEPESVKRADKLLLSTEARDLLINLRSDWACPVDPLPFIIKPWDSNYAKEMFIQRFYQLIEKPLEYKQYKKLYNHDTK